MERVGATSRDYWPWASYDYAKPMVQERYLDVIDGACRRYDLDGVELDWCRMARLFRYGEERKNVPIMNDFVQQVHNRLEHCGAPRGRRILPATRPPDSIEKCLDTGPDPETRARCGWLDLINAGTGMMPFAIPIRQWVDPGNRYDVAVHGSIDPIQPLFKSGRRRRYFTIRLAYASWPNRS